MSSTPPLDGVNELHHQVRIVAEFSEQIGPIDPQEYTSAASLNCRGSRTAIDECHLADHISSLDGSDCLAAALHLHLSRLDQVDTLLEITLTDEHLSSFHFDPISDFDKSLDCSGGNVLEIFTVTCHKNPSRLRQLILVEQDSTTRPKGPSA